jgi:dihydrofolate synthase/folylpolyglutamate synthase
MRQLSSDASLNDWLVWLEELHPVEIDLGLDRVREVAMRLDLIPSSVPVILVGGTNGKGSTVNLLTNAYTFAGYKTGAYTSPHIQQFNERMSINSQQASDDQIIAAFVDVERKRGDTSLTYFEFTTLASMQLFKNEQCELVILEVGLGGRLDATNLWDADCAIVTSIALDHQAYLGNTRESVAAEKVAIGRAGKPLIVGEPDPPENMRQLAAQADMSWIQIAESPALAVNIAGAHQRRNAACAVEAVSQLEPLLPVPSPYVQQALAAQALPGRFEQLEVDGVRNLLDVAHNPAAAQALALTIADEYPDADIHLVIGIMADKDVEGVIKSLLPIATNWFSTALPQGRALSSDELAAKIKEMDANSHVTACERVGEAWTAAQAVAGSGRATTLGTLDDKSVQDVVVTVGSFFMLSELQQFWQTGQIAALPVSDD